jgi:hypothetical protein
MTLRRHLTPLEARAVAVLVEKAATVPDTYPLSLNALTAGCNQKTARDPVMAVAEPDLLAALAELKALNLVIEVGGSRVVKFEHNLGRVLGVPGAAVALLTTLMLRGPQTAAELRVHCERLHRFADVSSVEGFLDELAEKAEPLVRKLPRAPGAREARWVHLLCGEEAAMVASASAAAAAPADAGLAEEVAVLRAEVAELRGQLGRLAAALGVDL